MKKLLLFSIFIFLNKLAYAPEESKEQRELKMNKRLIDYQNEILFKETIENLKIQEGLVLKPYQCPAGYWTIGYGHMIQPGERFTKITPEKAEEILLKDFKKSMSYLSDSLEYNKQLSLAHFIFNLGIGKYLKSKLKRAVDNGQEIDIILRYCFYKSNGKWKRSNWLYKARLFELEIYNYKYWEIMESNKITIETILSKTPTPSGKYQGQIRLKDQSYKTVLVEIKNKELGIVTIVTNGSKVVEEWAYKKDKDWKLIGQGFFQKDILAEELENVFHWNVNRPD